MIHVVNVGDMKLTTKKEDVIVTYALGSCLGVALYDAAAMVGGLFHVMLPNSLVNLKKAKDNPYMFVDTGTPLFFKEAWQAGADRRRIKVYVAGGADFSNNNSDMFAVGARNFTKLKNLFRKNGITIAAQNVGGSVARTLSLEMSRGRVWINANGEEVGL